MHLSYQAGIHGSGRCLSAEDHGDLSWPWRSRVWKSGEIVPWNEGLKLIEFWKRPWHGNTLLRITSSKTYPKVSDLWTFILRMTSQGLKIPSKNKLIRTLALKSLKITLKRIHKQISGDFNGIWTIYPGIVGPPGKKYSPWQEHGTSSPSWPFWTSASIDGCNNLITFWQFFSRVILMFQRQFTSLFVSLTGWTGCNCIKYTKYCFEPKSLVHLFTVRFGINIFSDLCGTWNKCLYFKLYKLWLLKQWFQRPWILLFETVNNFKTTTLTERNIISTDSK